MQLIGARDQQVRDHIYTADGTIASGNGAQLLLPERKSCSFLLIVNNSSGSLWLEFGGARATVTISNGALNVFTVTNSGFNYSLPPTVLLLGGGSGGNNLCPGATLPTWPAPGDPGFAAPRQGSTTARAGSATATLSGGSVSAINVNDPGAGYVTPPYVFLENNILDPNGVATPSASGSVGVELAAAGTAGNSIMFNGTACPTDAIAIIGASMGQQFACRWMY